MLQPGALYSTTSDISCDAYKVCAVLGRSFRVYKNEAKRYVLRCKGCKDPDCFTISAKPRVTEGGDTTWYICKVKLDFKCTTSPTTKRQYRSSHLMSWHAIPTANAFIPTSATGNKDGGQIAQLSKMIQQSDKVTLKKTQTASLISAKRKDSSEIHIQQYGLLHAYLEADRQNEVEAVQRYLNELKSHNRKPVKSPLGAYVLDTEWTMFDKMELPTFVRLMFTTGYAKSYWESKHIWRHGELDMCHVRSTFGGCIALLTHATSNGSNKILAFGVHPAENKIEWQQFYSFCKEHFRGIAHITNDQDKGLTSIEAADMRDGNLKRVTNCLLHIVRNENVARQKAGEGGFNVSLAGGTVQALATKLSKACTDDVYDYYLSKIKLGNKFTAAFLTQRRELFSTAYLLGHIHDANKSVQLSGPIPAEARRGKVTTNTAEQSNSNGGINKYRGLPVLDMIKGIATKMASQHFMVSS